MAKTYLRLLMFPIFTGLSFHAAAYTVQVLNAGGAAAWRFGIAAVLMLALIFWRGEWKGDVLRANWRMLIVLGLVGIFGFNIMIFWGLTKTSPINASLIMASNPLVTMILARLILHDQLVRRQWIGMVVSLLGVVLVITHGSWEVLRTLSFSVGDLMIVVANICWALYGVLGRRFVKGATPLFSTSITMVVGAVGLMLVTPLFPHAVSLPAVPLSAWGATLFMAVFTSVLGYLWWNQAILDIGASKTAVFFNLTPVVTMLASLLLGQAILWPQAVGTVFVIAGVLSASGLAAWRPTKKTSDNPTVRL